MTNISAMSTKRFLLFQIEPLFSSTTRDNVHHMNLYRCRVPNGSASFVTGQHYNCFSDAPKELNFCQDYVAGFGHGDDVSIIPKTHSFLLLLRLKKKSAP